MSQKTLLGNGIQAIKLAKKILDENRESSFDEKLILKKFTGFGGIKALLYPMDRDWNEIQKISALDLKLENEIKDFYNFISQHFENPIKIWNGIKESTLTSFYTPDFIAYQQIKQIYTENKNNVKNILDPCAGNGIYIEAFLNFYKNAKITAVEIDFVSALILKAIYNKNENVTIINKGFEEVKFNQKFDIISSNIPFGNFKVNYKEYNSKITDKIHNFFFYHSSNLLVEGGALSFLTSTGVFNSPSNKTFRELLSENLDFKSILTLPKNTFKNSGTEVTSHIISAIKNSKQINAKEKKIDFINTIKDDNGIELNSFIFNNFEKSFLEKPIISTNPYGYNEYNYTLDTDDLIKKISDNLYEFPKLNFEKLTEEKIEELIFNKNQEFIDDFFYFNNRIELIENLNIIGEKDKDSFETLGLVTVNYKGQNFPLATFGKIFSEEEQRKKYVIEYHINQFDSPKKTLLGREFKREFENFVKDLEILSEKYSLEIDVKNKEDYLDSREFKNYFLEKFNQPVLEKYFQTNFYNFSFHKKISEGMLVLNKSKLPCVIENIEIDENEKIIYELRRIKTTEENESMIVDYLQLYDAYNLYIKAEKDDDDLKSRYLKRLNNIYDTFVNNYGSINENKKINIFDSDYINILKALENYDENAVDESANLDLFTYQEKKGKWVKADIFYEKEIEKEIISPSLALAKSFNDLGRIDIDYISSLSNLSKEKIINDFQNKIILNPLNNQFEFRKLFFSGDILKKIKEIESISKQGENQDVLNQLEAILPIKIPFEAINLQFGSRWLPQNFIKEFSKRYFEQDFNMVFNENLDNFFVEPKGDLSNKYKSFNYCCINGRYVYPEQIIQNSFYDTYPVVTYSVEIDGNKVSYNDDEATKYFKREITNFRKEFLVYLFNLEQNDKDLISKIYNDKFNSIVIPDYDIDVLDFSIFNLKALGIKEIYDHQKRAVWKAINNEGGIIDHEVGLGKTFTIIATAFFGKKLGVNKKPIILGIKANVPVIAETFKALLPEANVLFASSKEFTKKEREIFLNKIRNNDYDAVIMSHEQFSRIEQNINIEKEVVESELNDVEDNLYNANLSNISKQQLKGLEIRKKNLSTRLDALLTKIKKNKDENVLNFSDLGVDHIIVDESHKYKNLMFQTKHTRVAGLGNTEGSQRATNLLLALRHIQQNTKTGDYGGTFFSGTPISNSITELYLLQKYLTPNLLKEKNIYNFDAWCSNFAEKSIDFETNMVNKVITKERFRYFTNLPELSLMYNYMADIMTGEMAKIDRPEKNEFLLLNEQTPLQKRFYVKLNKFLNTKDQSVLGLDKPLTIDSQSSALSLVAINLAFKASLDMRLISSRYEDEEFNKTNLVVKEILNRYKKFDEQKITQIVFLDISTPKKKLSFEELEKNYEEGIFTCLYDDLKYKLIKGGIPENEIAYIQHYETEKKKLNLSKKMNSGEIRILIGATENAGTGLNIQKRLGFINHFSIPWKPSELEQRNGRGFRTGNWFAKMFNNNKIDISISATKNTLDNYKIDINKNKQNFISQLKGASIGLQVSRKIDEGAMDENSGMSLAELQAQLTGDNSLLLKHQNDNKIKELEQEKMFILTKKSETEQKIALAEKKIRQFRDIKEIFSKDLEKYKNNVKFDDKNNRINKPNYIGLIDGATNEQIINHLKNIIEKANDYDEYTQKKVAELYGFDLLVKNEIWDGVKFFIRNSENDGTVTYSLNKGKINLESETAALTYFIRSLDLIENRIANTDKNINEEQNNIEVLKLNLNHTFDKEELLKELLIENERLEEKIKRNSSNSESIYETKEIIIDDQPIPFKIINDIHKLDIAILNEHLGSEYSENGIFCSNEIKEFLEEIANKNDCGFNIINQKLDFSTKIYFVRYEITNYDQMYMTFDKIKKEIDFSCLTTFLHYEDSYKNSIKLIHNYLNNKYYSYKNDAIKISELLEKEYKILRDVPIIKLSEEDIQRISAKEKNNNYKIEIFNKEELEELDNDLCKKIKK